LLLKFICRLFTEVYALLVQEVTLIPVLILKRALLIPQNKAVFASNLQLLAQKREILLYKLLTYILKTINIL
jgi:hypothetical protein